MNDVASLIADPTIREQIKVRYEAGERTALCREFGIDLRTLQLWSINYGWQTVQTLNLPYDQQVTILIEEGYTDASIARLLSLAVTTVRALRSKYTAIQVVALPGADETPRTRPAGHWGGWFCGSCSWWGENIDAYLLHTKKRHQEH